MIIKLHDKKLLKAAQKGDTDAVDELAQEGASVNAADSVERTALWHAASRGDTDMIEMLFRHHADPNRPDREGITPLIAALEGGHFKAAEQLLERADINVRTGDNEFTALHSAVYLDLKAEKTERVAFLLDKGADTTRVNLSNHTAQQAAEAMARNNPFAKKIANLIARHKAEAEALLLEEKRQYHAHIAAAFNGTEREIEAPAETTWKPRGPGARP